MKKVLLYLIFLLAVGLAGTVAYVSVTGLMKVFAGAGTIGLVFFIIIEVSKVIATSAIHTYGKLIKWYYRAALTLCIIGSMVITSIGIYGFLSSSYKSSFAKMESVNAQVELLETKRDGYQTQLNFLNEEKTSLNTTVTELTKGLSNNVIQYKDPETGEIITTTSSSTRKALEKQLDNAQVRLGDVTVKSDSLSNIIFDLENQILEVKLSNEAANELSTLQYLSDITGEPMDTVMMWMMLLFIVLGDPMAVLMVIIFNKVINKKKPEESEGDVVIEEPPTPTEPDNDDHFDEFPVPESEFDKTTGEIKLDGEVNPYDKTVWLGTYDDDVEDDVVEEVTEPEPDEITTHNEDVEHEEEDVVEPEPDELEEEKNIEDQIAENKQKLKDAVKTVTDMTKLPPVIPTGKVEREDIKEIKEQGTRGYSVDVPEPNKDEVRKVGTNKEVRKIKPNALFFNRPNK